ncbi:hypothetical protein D3C76_1832910 [compost metagenome]
MAHLRLQDCAIAAFYLWRVAGRGYAAGRHNRQTDTNLAAGVFGQHTAAQQQCAGDQKIFLHA